MRKPKNAPQETIEGALSAFVKILDTLGRIEREVTELRSIVVELGGSQQECALETCTDLRRIKEQLERLDQKLSGGGE